MTCLLPAPDPLPTPRVEETATGAVLEEEVGDVLAERAHGGREGGVLVQTSEVQDWVVVIYRKRRQNTRQNTVCLKRFDHFSMLRKIFKK